MGKFKKIFTIVALMGPFLSLALAEDQKAPGGHGYKVIQRVNENDQPVDCSYEYQGKCYASLDALQKRIFKDISAKYINLSAPEALEVKRGDKPATKGYDFDGQIFPSQEALVKHMVELLDGPNASKGLRLNTVLFGPGASLNGKSIRITLKSDLKTSSDGGFLQDGVPGGRNGKNDDGRPSINILNTSKGPFPKGSSLVMNFSKGAEKIYKGDDGKPTVGKDITLTVEGKPGDLPCQVYVPKTLKFCLTVQSRNSSGIKPTCEG